MLGGVADQADKEEAPQGGDKDFKVLANDITVKPLVELWNSAKVSKKVPNAEEILSFAAEMTKKRAAAGREAVGEPEGIFTGRY